MIKDFIHLLFPETCMLCSILLNKEEKYICLSCRYRLPMANLHINPDSNELFHRFTGKVQLKYAIAYLKFLKKGKVQKLIHELKYKGKEKLGEEIGIWYGEDLKEIEFIKKIDFIIPVPLHLKKLKKRGYNQSESFAKGLSMSLKIPILSTNIQRINSNDSQTTKSRLDRWENMEKAFEVTDKAIIHGKKVLLVDDVITTGSTLAACAAVIQPYVSETSIAGLALAC